MSNADDAKSSNSNEEKTASPCEMCGRRLQGFGWLGVEKAHIIAREYAPAHPWNIIDLCPSCHETFDHIVKPRIIRALKIAMEGFNEIPSQDKNEKFTKDFVIAETMEDIVCKLMKPGTKVVESLKGLDKIARTGKKKLWSARPKLQPAPKHKALPKTAEE